ncbi:MAG: UbiA family prenyltransferase [Deltaproteobacteria bacterium]|nr:UbiA family prenyltransferase [Deltaproteobacteria bacterium]
MSPRLPLLAASLGRLHIVAIATAACLTFGWMFTGRWPLLAAGVAALDWFLVNLLNRTVDVPEDRANAVLAAEVASRHRRALVAAGLAVLVLSLVAIHLVAPELTGWRIAGHLLGLAYNWPLLPGRRRIKHLYGWKNLASAAGMGITVFAYPLVSLLSGGAPLLSDVPPAGIGAALGFFLAFELSYEVIYDLRDREGDAQRRIPTLPVVHGSRAAGRVVLGLLALAASLMVVAWATSLLPWRIAVMGLAPLLQAAWFLRVAPRGIRGVDCVVITWAGAGLFAVYHAWEALGLPCASGRPWP